MVTRPIKGQLTVAGIDESHGYKHETFQFDGMLTQSASMPDCFFHALLLTFRQGRIWVHALRYLED